MAIASSGLCLAVALTLSFVPLNRGAAAQAAPGERPGAGNAISRTPLYLAVVEPFPYRNANAVIVRHAGAPDLVVVRRDRVDAARLASAVRLIQLLRAIDGSVLPQQTIVRVPESAQPGKYYAEASDWAAYLLAVAPQTLRGHEALGRVPYVRLLIPDGGVRVSSARD